MLQRGDYIYYFIYLFFNSVQFFFIINKIQVRDAICVLYNRIRKTTNVPLLLQLCYLFLSLIVLGCFQISCHTEHKAFYSYTDQCLITAYCYVTVQMR